MPPKAAGSVSPRSSGKSLTPDHIRNLSEAGSQSRLPMFCRTSLALSTTAAATSSAAQHHSAAWQGSCWSIPSAQAPVASQERGRTSCPYGREGTKLVTPQCSCVTFTRPQKDLMLEHNHRQIETARSEPQTRASELVPLLL